MLKRLASFYLTVTIPLTYAANLFLIWRYPSTLGFNTALALAGVVLAYIGLFLWIAAYFHLGRHFGVLPRRQNSAKHGLYRYFKHPMYLGISLCLLGLSLALASRSGLLFFVFFILPSLIIRAHLEERALKPASHR